MLFDLLGFDFFSAAVSFKQFWTTASWLYLCLEGIFTNSTENWKINEIRIFVRSLKWEVVKIIDIIFLHLWKSTSKKHFPQSPEIFLKNIKKQGCK